MWRALAPDESPGAAVVGTKQRKSSPEKLALKRLRKPASNHQTTASDVPGSERGSLLLRNEKGLLYFRRWTREGFVTWHVNGDGERLLRKHELWEGYRLSSNLVYELLKGDMLYTLNDEAPDNTPKR